MAVADRDQWDARHRERGEPGEPSPFLRSILATLPTRGRALDVAGGAGRHSLLLSRPGLEVTLCDISPEGLAIAAAAAGAKGLSLTTVARDLEEEPLPEGPFDVVLCFHFLDRRVYAGLADVLSPGGTLIVVHPTRTNLERHAHPGPRHLLEPGELPGLLPGIDVVRHEEAWLDEGRHEARLVGRAPLRR
jgi:tellurite methyltransferase